MDEKKVCDVIVKGSLIVKISGQLQTGPFLRSSGLTVPKVLSRLKVMLRLCVTVFCFDWMIFVVPGGTNP
jgi:hypothetical protein